MTILQDILAALGWQTRVNENFRSVSPAALYGIDPTTTTGLTFGYLGGEFSGVTVPNGTVALTASSTNYVVAHRTTGVVTAATNTTNWLNTGTYLQLYQFVAGASTFTIASTSDKRQAIGGAAASGMTNPMTTTGDIIYSSSGSTPARLGVGTNGYVLTLAAGLPTWAASSGGFSNPMTTSGDLILGGASGAPGRLGIGSNGQVLTVTAGAVGWAASAAGFANPMTTVGDLIVGGISGAAGRLAAGTSTFVLTSNGAGVAPTWQAASGGGGGLTGFTGALFTASPNNTINAAQLLVATASTNGTLVLSSKGTGAVTLQVADSTTAGGNIRGSNAIDLQMLRSNAAQVASGTNAFAAGINNTASNTYTVAIGVTNTSSQTYAHCFGISNSASGNESFAIGKGNDSNAANAVGVGNNNLAYAANGLTFGNNCYTDASYAMSTGRESRAWGAPGVLAFSSGKTSTVGDAQERKATLSGAVGGVGPIILAMANSGTSYFVIPDKMSVDFQIRIVARLTTTGDTATWKVEGAAKRVSGTLSLVGTPTVTALFTDAALSTAVIAVTADNTNKRISVSYTGPTATTSYVNAVMTQTEVMTP